MPPAFFADYWTFLTSNSFFFQFWKNLKYAKEKNKFKNKWLKVVISRITKNRIFMNFLANQISYNENEINNTIQTWLVIKVVKKSRKFQCLFSFSWKYDMNRLVYRLDGQEWQLYNYKFAWQVPFKSGRFCIKIVNTSLSCSCLIWQVPFSRTSCQNLPEPARAKL